MAATIPNKMAAPTRNSVIIDPVTQATTVTIDWVALDTSNSGGSPVTGYYIRRNNGYNGGFNNQLHAVRPKVPSEGAVRSDFGQDAPSVRTCSNFSVRPNLFGLDAPFPSEHDRSLEVILEFALFRSKFPGSKVRLTD